MNIAGIGKTLTLFKRIFDTSQSTIPIINFLSNKPAFKRSESFCPLPRSTPEAEGISSEIIKNYIRSLADEPGLNMHNLIIARNGRIIFETSFAAQDLSVWKNAFSESKSITSLAIGMLIDDKLLSLDDKITDIFRKSVPAISRLKLKDLTVENLLTMTSTVLFNESESITSEDWIKCYFNSALKGSIGDTFNYNSLNSYILSAIVKEISGNNLSDFLKPRLFDQLGISNYYWEKCPSGIDKGGWGLYILPEDMLKIGMVILNDGMWNGTKLISSEWIHTARTAHITPHAGSSEYSYGYHIWAGKSNNSFLLNGMFGQNILGFPGNNIIVASNAGNGDMFQSSSFFKLTEETFSGINDDKLPENKYALRSLNKLAEGLRIVQKPVSYNFWEHLFTRNVSPLPGECVSLDGKSYTTISNSKSIGLFPTALSMLQNNYTDGTEKIGFKIADGFFYVDYIENDENYLFPVGFSYPAETVLTFHGESYLVRITGVFKQNEDDIPVFKLRLTFLETPCERYIKIFILGDTLKIEYSETPGLDFADKYLNSIKEGLSGNSMLSNFISKLDIGFVEYKIKALLNPTVIFKKQSSADQKQLTKNI